MSGNSRLTELFGLEGKVAIVTGAANGIGRGIAELFDAAGATVVAADIDFEGAKQFEASAKGKALALKLDQGDRESVRQVFATVDKQFGRLDAIVNCAAIYPFMEFEKVTPEFLTRNLNINVNGLFYCMQESVVLMKRGGRGGSIVNISSVNSRIACVYDNIHYGAAKAAVNAMTTGVALEYAPFDIRANAVMPGSIATQAAGRAATGYPLKGPILLPGRCPLKGKDPSGQGEPLDIATACLYFASDASRFVTGQVMSVDGGFLIG